MKHRRDWENRVVMADGKRVRAEFGEGVQNERAVRVEDTFGVARGARRVAHYRAIIFVHRGVMKIVACAGQQLLIVQNACRHAATTVRYDNHFLKRSIFPELLKNRKENIINDEESIGRVPGDCGNLVRMQSQVQCVQNAAGARHAKECFQVAGVIPHHRCDAITRLKSQFGERVGETPGAAVHLSVASAVGGAVRPARNDFDASEELARTLQDHRERQWRLHHRAAHSPSLLGGRLLASYHQSGRSRRKTQAGRFLRNWCALMFPAVETSFRPSFAEGDGCDPGVEEGSEFSSGTGRMMMQLRIWPSFATSVTL